MKGKEYEVTASENTHAAQGLQMQELDIVFQLLGSENDLIVSDRNGIVLRVSDQYEMHYGLQPHSIVGRSIYDLEWEGVFKPCVTAIVLRKKRKVTVMQTNLLSQKILATGIPMFGADKQLKYVASFNSLNIAGMLTPAERLKKVREIVDSYETEIKEKHLRNMAKEHLIFNSHNMEQINRTILQIADTNASVLLTGETGVGKSMIARIIHKCSLRAPGPFVEINCGAIPESLIESELFGYVGGAFTGADAKGKIGKIQAAEGGTLFLDEIGEMSLNMQLRLLQVLQGKKIVRIGSHKEINVDFRLITATNRDLKHEISQGQFRMDLYYRIHVVPLEIPPLRERREDIIPLTVYFLSKYNAMYKKQIEFSKQTFSFLEKYSWPGNIRELENEIERAVIMSGSGVVESGQFSFKLNPGQMIGDIHNSIDVGKTFQEMMEDYEREIIIHAHQKYTTSVEVGKALKIGQTTASRKLRKYVGKLTG